MYCAMSAMSFSTLIVFANFEGWFAVNFYKKMGENDDFPPFHRRLCLYSDYIKLAMYSFMAGSQLQAS